MLTKPALDSRLFTQEKSIPLELLWNAVLKILVDLDLIDYICIN